ncbi:hypothetical protein IT779_10295 [Nocardia sp. NEAU-351]|uniref:Uncharacterized protein n=1 Tax=Nocardia bovistercoris TaxID=2785916 RepID=A0A931IBA8_9NOCA|nr:hypothetical protein [Nocardia bovistercoris]
MLVVVGPEAARACVERGWRAEYDRALLAAGPPGLLVSREIVATQQNSTIPEAA